MAFSAAPYFGMDHAVIEETQLAERYVLGRAGEQERLAFEEHCVDCTACQERLEAAAGLRSALQDLAAARLLGSQENGPTRASAGARRVAFLAAAAGLAAGTLATLLYFQVRRMDREILLAREAATQAQAALERRSLQSNGPSAAAPAAAAPSVPLAAPVFLLNLTRGSGPGEPENQVVLSTRTSWVTLVFDRPEGSASSYRVRLGKAQGRAVYEAVVERPRSPMLSVTLSTGSLAAGDYVLTVEGLDDSAARAVTRYLFRVTALASAPPASRR